MQAETNQFLSFTKFCLCWGNKNIYYLGKYVIAFYSIVFSLMLNILTIRKTFEHNHSSAYGKVRLPSKRQKFEENIRDISFLSVFNRKNAFQVF